ncbi:MAG: hypothetical protein Q8Q60_01495 [Candidatus Chromulinivorax sp.]|nr:hypothetical protein [Candidatus Chromulinivorax sp.]
MNSKIIMFVILFFAHYDFVFASKFIESKPNYNSTQPEVKTSGRMNALERDFTKTDPLSYSNVLHERDILTDDQKNIASRKSVQRVPVTTNPLLAEPMLKEASVDFSKEPIQLTNKPFSEDLVMKKIGLDDLRTIKKIIPQATEKNSTIKKGVDVTNDVARKQAEIKTISSLIKTIIDAGLVIKNTLLEQIMLKSKNSKDINAEYALVKGFGSTGSRNTLQVMYKQLDVLKSMKPDGKIRLGFFKAVKFEEFKELFARTLIQKQIDNNLGMSSMSFQSMYSLPADQQNALVKRFVDPSGKYKNLFSRDSKITNVKKLQLIAEMNDDVMNVISKSLSIDKNGNLALIDASKGGNRRGAAIFASNYNPDGSYRSQITIPSYEGDCSVTTVLDVKGKQISRSLAADGDEYTVVSRSGWFYGSYKNLYEGSAEEGAQYMLSSNAKAMFDTVVDLTSAVTYLRINAQLAMQDMQANLTAKNAKKVATSTAKIGLLAGKQYLIYQFGALTHIPLASSAVLLPVVKLISLIPAMYEINPLTGQVLWETKIKNGEPVRVPKVKSFTGYQFTGHSYDDPTMLLVALKAIDLTVGDKGQSIFTSFLGGQPWLSGEGDRVIRKGTPPANALQWLQGKESQQENPYETYVDAIPAVLQTAYAPLKLLFPKTLGSTILSKADLRKSSSVE